MSATNLVMIKLRRIMGDVAASTLVDEVLSEMAIPNLDTPDRRLAFGEGLCRRGGIYEVLGRAIRTQAALQGAKPAA